MLPNHRSIQSSSPLAPVTPRLVALALATPAIASLVALQPTASAQLIPDATLGIEQSIIDSATVRGDLANLIRGGALRDSNLFHSFLEFNVQNGQRVYFFNPEGIENIFGRVTGGNPSNILGTLGVDGAANLFLMNPNGIVFGPNAQLDLEGAFWASTADRIEFGDGSNFSARSPEAAPLVTVNIPIGLQFAADAPAAVRNSGVLEAGTDLRLSGGDVISEGALVAQGLVKLEGVSGDVRISGNGEMGEMGRSLQAGSAELTAARNVVLAESRLETTGDLTVSARDITITGEINVGSPERVGRIILDANRGTLTLGEIVDANRGQTDLSGDQIIMNPQNGSTFNGTVNFLKGNVSGGAINGGNDQDIFNFESVDINPNVNVNGLGGNDIFNFNPGSSVVNVNGGAGEDTFNFNGGEASGIVNGNEGNDRFNINSGESSGRIEGGTESDTIAGSLNDDVFNITGENQGSLGGVRQLDATFQGGIRFTGIENLQGGPDGNTSDGKDRFKFFSGGSVVSIDGGGDTDILDYGQFGATIEVNFNNSSATGVLLNPGNDAIRRIDAVIGDSTAGGTVIGISDQNIYTVATAADEIGTNDFRQNEIIIFDITQLTANEGNDTLSYSRYAPNQSVNFILNNELGQNSAPSDAQGSATIGGSTLRFRGIQSLIGSQGRDSLAFPETDLSSQNFRLDNISPFGANGGIEFPGAAGQIQFAAIESIDGGAGDDVLQGTQGPDYFSITGADSGGIRPLSGGEDMLSFSRIGTLYGREGDDTFAFEGGFLSGLIEGGDGSNTIAGSTTKGDNFSALSGNSISGSITINSSIINFQQIQSFNGQVGAIDTFTGTSEPEIFRFTDSSTIQTINRNTNSSFLLSNFEVIDGGDIGSLTPNILQGTEDGNFSDVFSLNGANSGTIQVTEQSSVGPEIQFRQIQTLEARAGNDRFSIASTGSITNPLDGGDGNDTVAGLDQVTDPGDLFQITGLKQGTLNGTIDFTDIEVLDGRSGNDTVVGTAQGDVFSLANLADGQLGFQLVQIESLNGLGGSDTLIGSDGSDRFSFLPQDSGRNRGEVTNISLSLAFEDIETLDGAGGSDIFDLSIGTFDGILRGGTGADQFNFSGGELRGTANGGAGNDSFVIGSPTGFVRLNDANLEGGMDDDEFVFLNGSSVLPLIKGGDGSVNGPGDGTDKIRFENYGSVSAIARSEFEGQIFRPGAQIPQNLIVDYQSIEGLVGDSNSSNEILGTEEADNFVVTQQIVTLNGVDQPLGSTQLVNFTTLNGIGGADQFFLKSGEIGAIRAGAGNDIVFLQGGRITNLLEGEEGTLTLVANPAGIFGGLEGLEGLPGVVTGSGGGRAIAIEPADTKGNIFITQIDGTLQYNGSSLAPIQQSTFDELIIGSTDGSGSVTVGSEAINDRIRFSSPMTTIQGGSILAIGDISSPGNDLKFIANDNNFNSISAALSTATLNDTNAGSIIIEARQGEVQINSIKTTASGNADAGNISITGASVIFPNVNPSIQKPQRIDPAAFGSGATGAVNITALSGDVVLNNGIFFADTFSEENQTQGGNLSITANQGRIVLDSFALDSRIQNDATVSSQGSSILLSAGTEIKLENDSRILNAIDPGATGRAGNVEISAPVVTLDRSSISSNVAGKTGAIGGDIRIETGKFSLNNNSRLSGNVGRTSEDESVSSNGDGGNIIVKATETDPSTPTILLDTTSSISSEMGSETTGDGTSITLEGASIQLQAGSEIRATNAGSGNGGTIQFSNLSTDTPGLSQRIEVNGTAGSPVIETTVSGSGRGSDITFNGNVIDINSAEIKADTSSDAIAGTGGNIEIRGQQLSLDAETTISANTTGAANSGAIILSGTGSSTIDTPSLTLDGTTISNTASSSGASGRVQLQGAAIELSNGVEIRADNSGSSPGEGVSIESTQSVQVDQSSISTSTSAEI